MTYKIKNILNELYGEDVHKFYEKELSSYKPKGKVKHILYHGTNVHPSKFAFDPDFDADEFEGNFPRDYEIPYGVVFLTTDFKEANAYGRYVIPCFIETSSVLAFKVNSNAPSQVFDDDYNYVGKMYPKFEAGGYDVLEVRGYGKSTFIAYPNVVNVRSDLAAKIYDEKLKEFKLTEAIDDDEFTYWKQIPKIEKALNIKVKDHIKSGTRSSAFELVDGRVLKITNDSADAAGLKYAMENHPKIPVLKVYSVNRIPTGEEDALGNKYYNYVAVSERLQPIPHDKADEYSEKIIDWFDRNTDVKPWDVHAGNIGISKDKSTPLGGLVFLDPKFYGKTNGKDIPISESLRFRMREAYDDVPMDHIKSKKKFEEYSDYDDKKVVGDVGYLHFKTDDEDWDTWGEIKAFNIEDGTEVGNVSYGKQRKGDRLKASVDVRSDFRRKGIATQMYDWVEDLTGERLYPDTPHSPSANKFWASRKQMKGLDEKSVSKSQQRLMGMALAYKRGELPNASQAVKDLADSMTTKELEDFASTKHKGLPEKKKNETIRLADIYRELHEQFYEREDMPQVEDIPEAVKKLKEMGVQIKKEKCTPADMKHAQIDYNPEKVEDMAKTIKVADMTPIVLSLDNYIVDGNHRKMALDAIGESNTKVPVYRIYLNRRVAIQKYKDVADPDWKG